MFKVSPWSKFGAQISERRAVYGIAGVTLLAVAVAIGSLVTAHGRDSGLSRPVASAAKPNPTSVVPALGGGVPIPKTGAYLGAHVDASVAGRERAFTKLELSAGRRLAIDHVYYRWDAPFPSDYDRWTVSQGRIPFISWTSRRTSGPATSWSDITLGKQDELIDARAKAIRDLHQPVLLGFAAEPRQLIGSGTSKSGASQELVSAFRHIVERFRVNGATNASWMWTLTANEFRTGDPLDTYPGDQYVDWVGVDGYTNLQCPWLKVPWMPFRQLFAAATKFARDHGKPLAIAEFNLREDPTDPTRKGRWLEDVAQAVKADPTVRAVISFDSSQPCAAVIDTSPDALRGYRTLAQSPWMSPTLASERRK